MKDVWGDRLYGISMTHALDAWLTTGCGRPSDRPEA